LVLDHDDARGELLEVPLPSSDLDEVDHVPDVTPVTTGIAEETSHPGIGPPVRGPEWTDSTLGAEVDREDDDELALHLGHEPERRQDVPEVDADSLGAETLDLADVLDLPGPLVE